MSMDNLTAETKTAIGTASKTAARLGHRAVRPEHLLIGLLAVPESTPARILMGYGLYAQIAEARVAALAPPGSVPAGSSLFSDSARSAIAEANRLAVGRGETAVDVVSFARAVLATGDELVEQVLSAVNVSAETVLAALDAATPPAQPTAAEPAAPSGGGTGVLEPEDGAPAPSPVAVGKALASFGRDMVEQARQGKLDPVAGREAELERVMVALARRSKNNPVLIGEPGVGKTAVVEALAARIAEGRVPTLLAGRPLVSLDLSGMLAGTKFRGDFEERLKAALGEARSSGAILFIDELHQVVGAGAAAGGMDVANILKPFLARGEIALVGATTLDEYRKHIEKDAALERRFQPVRVEEPSVAATVDILRQLRPRYAAHHRVSFTDEALEAAAKLADRYITDRFLPDKAIDVLDEAGAAAGMAVLRTAGPARELYAARAQVREALAKAGTEGDYAAAATLAGEADALTGQLLAATGTDLAVVDAAAVAQVVAEATGVPVTAIGEVEAERLRDLPARLGARVIGQGAAVEAVAKAIRRVRQGLTAGTRPSSFIFAGPTGVGKTELAKALADDLFGQDAEGRGAFIHLDMSEYAEKSSVARLFGAPPGYVGYDDGGQLTEKVRRSPYAVVLLDEVEKAHPEVFDALLQVLEDGRLTDGTGRTVDFRNVILVMTTNLGAARAARPALGFGPTSAAAVTAAADQHTREALKEHFRPEFLNRVDEVVVFGRLERADLDAIVETLLAPVRAQLAARDVTLEVSPAAVTALLDAGHDPALGARPLRRAITRLLVDPLSEALLTGAVRPGTHVVADADPGDPAGPLALTSAEPAPPVGEPLTEAAVPVA